MAETRTEQRATPQTLDATLVTAETLRNSSQANLPAAPAKSEDKIPVFWRIFGATLLSIAALVVITLCQHYTNSINELRGDLGHLNEDLRKDLAHLNESQGNLVQKQEFDTRIMSVWSSMKELQSLSGTVAALKEKALVREEQMKAQDERKELVRELQMLRERLATLEGRQGVVPATKPIAVPVENAIHFGTGLSR